MQDAVYRLRRMHLPKLFGKSEWVPNRDYESGQDGSKESRSADSWRQRCALETPSAIFQTVSEGVFSEVVQGGPCTLLVPGSMVYLLRGKKRTSRKWARSLPAPLLDLG